MTTIAGVNLAQVVMGSLGGDAPKLRLSRRANTSRGSDTSGGQNPDYTDIPITARSHDEGPMKCFLVYAHGLPLVPRKDDVIIDGEDEYVIDHVDTGGSVSVYECYVADLED